MKGTIATIITAAIIGLFGCIILAPCLLTLTEGENGEMTIWNFVGIAYTIALVAVAKRVRWF